MRKGSAAAQPGLRACGRPATSPKTPRKRKPAPAPRTLFQYPNEEGQAGILKSREQGPAGVFVIPNEEPLDLTGRIVSWGKNQ